MKIDKVIRKLFPETQYFFRFRTDNEIFDERYPYIAFQYNVKNIFLDEISKVLDNPKLSKDDVANLFRVLEFPSDLGR